MSVSGTAADCGKGERGAALSSQDCMCFRQSPALLGRTLDGPCDHVSVFNSKLDVVSQVGEGLSGCQTRPEGDESRPRNSLMPFILYLLNIMLCAITYLNLLLSLFIMHLQFLTLIKYVHVYKEDIGQNAV